MAPNFKRIVCLVADGFGVGAAPDAGLYGDEGSNTLGHIADAVSGLRLENLQKLGLGNLGNFQGIAPTKNPLALVSRLAEKSVGKDTTTGHWEIAGLVTEKALATFPEGFPQDLLDAFIREAKVPGILGNTAASGTEIITRLGAEHLATGKPIVYTSADSVFQIAAHEGAFGLERLYEICRIARRLTIPYQIGRVIARPFIGNATDGFTRTENRRDYTLTPGTNALDVLEKGGVQVVSVGKIEDIFDHRAITHGNHTGNNRDSLAATLDYMQKLRNQKAFIFVNLVDFDMLYGHRRDVKGYAGSLVEFDNYLPKILAELTPEDAVLITADHGCDPTFRGTDHTREYVPMLMYQPEAKGGLLPERNSFSDIGASVLEAYGLSNQAPAGMTGKSFLCSRPT